MRQGKPIGSAKEQRRAGSSRSPASSNGNSAYALAEFFRDRYDRFIDSKREVSPCHTNRASALGHSCDYHGYLNRVAWSKQSLPDRGLQRIFYRGNVLESVIRRMLEDMGIRITDEQYALSLPEYEITGHIDGAIADTERWGRVPVDIKTTGNPIFARARTEADLRAVALGEKWYAQVQLYLKALKTQWALIIIVDVTTFQMVAIPIEANPEYQAKLLDRATRINEAVKRHKEAGRSAGTLRFAAEVQKTLPPVNNARICSSCHHYGTSCFPEMKFSKDAGVKVIDDGDLYELLDRRDKLEDRAAEFRALDKQVKEGVRMLGRRVVIRDFLIENDPKPSVSYNVPEKIKARYREETPSVKTTISRVTMKSRPKRSRRKGRS